MKHLRDALLVLCLSAQTATATVDLLLDITYEDPADERSHGSWDLFVKAEHFGLESVSFWLETSPAGFGWPPMQVQVMAPMGFVAGTSGTPIRVGLQPSTMDGRDYFEFRQLDYHSYSNFSYMLHGLGTKSFGEPATSGANQAIPWPAQQLWLNVPWATTTPRDGWETGLHLLHGEFLYGVPPYFPDRAPGFGARVFTRPPLGCSGGLECYMGTIEQADVRLFVQHNRGDYNADGRVDAADHTRWRDANRPPTEYEMWKENFGQPYSWQRDLSEAASGRTVPEPGMYGLALVSLGLTRLGTRCRPIWLRSRRSFGA